MKTFERSKSHFKQWPTILWRKHIVVEWYDNQHFSHSDHGVTFEAILYEGSNNINSPIEQVIIPTKYKNLFVVPCLINLSGNFSFQYVVLSSAEKINHLARSTGDQLNRSGQTQPVNEHLYSIYEHAVSRQVKDVDREEFLFVFFPVAEKNSEAFMSGVLKELVRAHIIPVTVDERNQVISILRRLLTCNL